MEGRLEVASVLVPTARNSRSHKARSFLATRDGDSACNTKPKVLEYSQFQYTGDSFPGSWQLPVCTFIQSANQQTLCPGGLSWDLPSRTFWSRRNSTHLYAQESGYPPQERDDTKGAEIPTYPKHGCIHTYLDVRPDKYKVSITC